MGVMAKMGAGGDLKVIWDPTKEDEVESARSQFNTLTRKGYSAFNVTRDGTPAARMDRFDPQAEKIILSLPIAGG